MRNVMISAVLVLAASAAVATAAVPDASGWQIGPVIRGKNYSIGMPPGPTPGRQGWYFDFPYPSPSAGHVHALTFDHGPLTGKSRIVMRYRIDAERGVRIMPREAPGSPATITMFFQRRGDSWNAKGRYEAYRWYAPTVVDIRPGVHEISVSFNDNWAAVMNSTARTNPIGFRDAINDAERVGFVLGARVGGAGHGVFATGPARMTVLSFKII